MFFSGDSCKIARMTARRSSRARKFCSIYSVPCKLLHRSTAKSFTYVLICLLGFACILQIAWIGVDYRSGELMWHFPLAFFFTPKTYRDFSMYRDLSIDTPVVLEDSGLVSGFGFEGYTWCKNRFVEMSILYITPLSMWYCFM